MHNQGANYLTDNVTGLFCCRSFQTNTSPVGADFDCIGRSGLPIPGVMLTGREHGEPNIKDDTAISSMTKNATPSPLATVANARRRFERVLAGWASDLLTLSRRRRRRSAPREGVDPFAHHCDSSW
ncbi:MAG: hypothetical protein FJ253_05775 [Phycisphaerae bacterium]|nr:hypothetical protein [Phycisphaerae bacterium]